jgi:hypothetical protein
MSYIKMFEEYNVEKNLGILLETGEKFWIGSVNVMDGHIEEIHTYEEAYDYDFHHSFYFSIPQCEKIREGECQVFWIEFDGQHKGNIESDCTGGELPIKILEKVKKQIKII